MKNLINNILANFYILLNKKSDKNDKNANRTASVIKGFRAFCL